MATNKATFYILKTADMKARDLFTCRVIEKIYQNKHNIYVHAADATEVATIDTQLWTFRDISFIPHEIYNTQNAAMQILIGCTTPPPEHTDVLVNLTNNLPEFYNNFSHIVEIVADIPELKQAARQRYKLYQQQNIVITTHEQ